MAEYKDDRSDFLYSFYLTLNVLRRVVRVQQLTVDTLLWWPPMIEVPVESVE